MNPCNFHQVHAQPYPAKKSKRLGNVQKGLSSKAEVPLARGAYSPVPEHAKGARTPLADFFNIPIGGRKEAC